MELLQDEREILMDMIQIEDHGFGSYYSVPDLRKRIAAKGLEKDGRATPLAREMLRMPKPAPRALMLFTMRPPALRRR